MCAVPGGNYLLKIFGYVIDDENNTNDDDEYDYNDGCAKQMNLMMTHGNGDMTIINIINKYGAAVAVDVAAATICPQ